MSTTATAPVPTLDELRTQAEDLLKAAKAEGLDKAEATAMRANARLLQARALVMAEAPELLIQPETPKEPTPAEQFSASRERTLELLRTFAESGTFAPADGEVAALITGLEQPIVLAKAAGASGTRAAPGTQAGTKGRVGTGESTAAERIGPDGKMLRKLWPAITISGPFMGGVCNAAGGYLVRDIRTDVDSVSRDGLTGIRLSKKAEMTAYIAEQVAKCGLSSDELAAFAGQARARIATDGTAR